MNYNSRRPRLLPEEVPLAYSLIWNRLNELHQSKSQPELAKQLFKILYRYSRNSVGKPHYPSPITWNLIFKYLEITIELETIPETQQQIRQLLMDKF